MVLPETPADCVPAGMRIADEPTAYFEPADEVVHPDRSASGPAAELAALRAGQVGVVGWDELFLNVAREWARRSKDPSTQVGCVIVGRGRTQLSQGYNGFPRGVADAVPSYCKPEGEIARTVLPRYQRPTKYLYAVHAEANAIVNAARIGVSLEGATLYTTLYTCGPCAGLIVNAGIAEVVYPDGAVPAKGDHFAESHEAADAIFAEAAVKVRCVPWRPRS